MSTPVVTDKWSGTFDCGTCKRKRLIGAEFSKKALEKHRKTGAPLKCKACVASIEMAERKAALERAAKKQASNANASNDDVTAQPSIICAKCQKSLAFSSFTKNQYNKGSNKGRCQSCVNSSIKDEEQSIMQQKKEKIQQAKLNVANAKTPMELIKAESELAALEAQHVTGLKPIKMGRGGGRGRGRSSGRGRGSASGRGRGRSVGRGRGRTR